MDALRVVLPFVLLPTPSARNSQSIRIIFTTDLIWNWFLLKQIEKKQCNKQQQSFCWHVVTCWKTKKYWTLGQKRTYFEVWWYSFLLPRRLQKAVKSENTWILFFNSSSSTPHKYRFSNDDCITMHTPNPFCHVMMVSLQCHLQLSNRSDILNFNVDMINFWQSKRCKFSWGV